MHNAFSSGSKFVKMCSPPGLRRIFSIVIKRGGIAMKIFRVVIYFNIGDGIFRQNKTYAK